MKIKDKQNKEQQSQQHNNIILKLKVDKITNKKYQHNTHNEQKQRVTWTWIKTKHTQNNKQQNKHYNTTNSKRNMNRITSRIPNGITNKPIHIDIQKNNKLNLYRICNKTINNNTNIIIMTTINLERIEGQTKSLS